MSYVEIVLQVRDDETNTILDHFHFHIDHTNPTTFTQARMRELMIFLHAHEIPHLMAPTDKPCSLCYTLGKEKPLDRKPSKNPRRR
jgi:hypothetical protein